MTLTPRNKRISQAKLLTRRIKELTIAFINMADTNEMQFSNKGDIATAKKLVQSIRVKLSRIRIEVRIRELHMDNFMMRLKSYVYDEKNDTTIITLTKTAPIPEIEKDVNDMFNEINNTPEVNINSPKILTPKEPK